MKFFSLIFISLFIFLVNTVQAGNRFQYSPDGSEVTDNRTGLTWRRCAEGMTWISNTCSGTYRAFSFEGALAHARTQNGWRVPNVKELASIVDRNFSSPAIDLAVFPATMSDWFWTSTPKSGPMRSAWYVNFMDGIILSSDADLSVSLRLVR